MGKTISLLRPLQPPREEETEMMELRKQPRPRRVDPDFVSSPPPLPPRKRAQKQVGAAGTPKRQTRRKGARRAAETEMMELRKHPRPRLVDPDFVSSPPPLPPRKRAQKQVEAAGAPKRQPRRKGARRAAVGIGCPVAGLHPATCGRQPPLRTSTRVLFRLRHPFNWYEPDMWTEVAKHQCGIDLLRLLADDSIWRYTFFRDLNLSDANPRVHRPLFRSWRCLYFGAFDGSHAFSFSQNAEHRSSWRIGSFVLDSPDMVLIARLPVPKWLPLDPEDARVTIAILGSCKLVMAGRPEIVNDKLVVEAQPWFVNKEELDNRKKCNEYLVVIIIWSTCFRSDSTTKVASYSDHGDSVPSLLFEKQKSGGFELSNSLCCLLSYMKEYNTHCTGFVMSPSINCQHLQPRISSELSGEETCLAVLRTDGARKEMILLLLQGTQGFYFCSDSTTKVASYNNHGDSVPSLLFEKQKSGGFKLSNSLWCLLSYLKEYNTHCTGFVMSPSINCQHLQPRISSELSGEETCLALLRTDDARKEMIFLLSQGSYRATSTGSSRTSATRSSTRIANSRSTVENAAPSSKRITRKSSAKRGDGEDDEEDGPGDRKEQSKTKDAGTRHLRIVTVGCVEDLESLDPNTARLSIRKDTPEEAASEILREGNRRSFLFHKNKPYYKAVLSCICENTESEEKDSLDPDYQPCEEHGETGADEEEAEPEDTDAESSDVEDMGWVIIEESDCFENEGGETEAEGVEPEEASGSPDPAFIFAADEPEEASDSPDQLEASPDQEEASDSLDQEEASVSPDEAFPFAGDDFDPVPLDIIPPQSSGSPSPSVGGSIADSPPPAPPSAPPTPASSVGPSALAIWMHAEDGEASSSSHVHQSTAADDDHDTAEGNQGNQSPSPPPPPPSAPSCPASSAGPVALSIWMPAGRPQYAARLAFATVTPAERAVNPSPFICAALYANLPQLHYNLLPSSRGTMLLRFDGAVERNEAVECSPFHHDGGRVVLERAEETTNRYRIPLPWLAAISAADFPPEHWFDENIRAGFRCLGTVIEIDPDCLDETDYSSLRVVVEVDREFLPLEMEMGVNSPDGGGGSVVHLRTLRVWDRHLQFDAAGQYIPFFTRTRTE